MPQIEFGSRDAANKARQKLGQFLTESDSRRSKTVKLKQNTPDSLIERVREDALQSREQEARGAGKEELTEQEKESLKRSTTFTWQQNGFEAMAVKAAMQAEGVTEWMDYYEPGEGVDSALRKLRQQKNRGQQTRASAGVESDFTDTEEIRNTGRRARQSERVSADRIQSAKRPAIVEQDTEATAFLQEEQEFGEAPWDVNVEGERSASGRDVELVEERHENRSQESQFQDELRAAPITKNPLKWSQNPGKFDFPGVDTQDPEVIHSTRSERAQTIDEREIAPSADSVTQWAKNPDKYDWPGVDRPNTYGPTGDESQPSPERNTQAPEPETTALAKRDVPLSPEEAFEGVGSGSQDIGATNKAFGLAGDREADMAFAQAEEARRAESQTMKDTRALQDTLSFAGDATEARESRMAEEQSSGGLMEDTRESVDRGVETNDMDSGEQMGFGDMAGVEKAFEEVDEDASRLDQF